MSQILMSIISLLLSMSSLQLKICDILSLTSNKRELEGTGDKTERKNNLSPG